ncbi:MAG TPA: NAD(P)H-dependent oxidoreductase [Methanospirillum sp.]|nr:NAD(P)H-dependent oxidoreductase [Methanospirillum sp.]
MDTGTENIKTRSDTLATWKCTVCGLQLRGEKAPRGCPNCHSPSGEFIHEQEHVPFTYDGTPFDVLLINASTHRAGNTGIMTDIAEEVLSENGVLSHRINLNEYTIDHCWCCYAVRAQSCDYPCRNKNDDMHTFHTMLASSKAVIVASPINWNSMSARLKTFLDRTTCMQNLYHLKKSGLTDGKVLGILVCGHEDGGIKTAMDIFLNFQQMGYILAPFGIAYRTHGAEFSSNADRDFFKTDEMLRLHIRGVTNNVVEMMRLDTEKKLKGRLVPISE